jgi:hypothetical protein
LGIYLSYKRDLVLATAEANDVELLIVPAGAAERAQSLDPGIFGELKSHARAEFGRRMFHMGQSGVNHDQRTEFFIRCWNAIPAENDRKAWDIIYDDI